MNWEAISKCSKTSEGSELLKKYGEATHSLDPPVSFIPTILLNKSQGNQKDILKSLLTEVCALQKVYPLYIHYMVSFNNLLLNILIIGE